MGAFVLKYFMLLCFSTASFANPYFDRTRVPENSSYPSLSRPSRLTISGTLPLKPGQEILRIAVNVDVKEHYSLTSFLREWTGTNLFISRAKFPSKLGSYRAQIIDPANNRVLAYDSIGTGKEYRKLVDEITFRFPMPKKDIIFQLFAENPDSGKMQLVLRKQIRVSKIQDVRLMTSGLEIRKIGKSDSSDGKRLRMNVYAEGYRENRRNEFWLDAAKAVATLGQFFPRADRLEFFAVFRPSKEVLGSARDLGLPIPIRNSYLGFFYPYWHDFGRWYNVVYPSHEKHFRDGIAVAPYDYTLVLIDDQDPYSYWGMGNFRVTTAVPARNPNFIYLLLHEMGHFFGLNEEYGGTGRTELEFAPGIKEPWSQNITFLNSNKVSDLKWSQFVDPKVPLPTPDSNWDWVDPQSKQYGAYQGGYAESEPLGRAHIPGLSCVMDTDQYFCDICQNAIQDVMDFDSGMPGL